MLNVIWPIFIIISFIYALITGNVEKVSNGIFDSASSAVELTLTFFGTICLWNGIMSIAKKTTLMSKLTKILQPAIKFLFPELKHNEQAKKKFQLMLWQIY